MQLIRELNAWWRDETGDEASPLDGNWPAFVVSLLVHMLALIALGLVPVALKDRPQGVLVTAAPHVEELDLETPEEFRFSDELTEEIGASSAQGEAIAAALAPVIAEVAVVPNHLDIPITEVARPQIEINHIVQQATGLRYSENLAVRGAAGEGTTGASGAIDRITHEILLSLEERKTLIVWLFDQTASIVPQRQTIRDRFSRIYEELGVIESTGNVAFTSHDDAPLVSAVVGFGSGVHWMTKQPTDNLAELKQAVMDIPIDDSGTENTFAAISEAAKRFSQLRYTASERSRPERNVLLVVFTDEAGSDTQRAEEAIKLCRRLAMPVYVVGVPAPFGRKETEMKWVDPDPKFDQTPRWGLVEQGPESFLPERIKLGFSGSAAEDDAIDSGFGPYALTRLCYESGGIYFAVHPNRNVSRRVGRDETAAYSSHLRHFFDPEVMRQYRPDYLSIGEYQKRVGQNKARAALVQASASSAQLDLIEQAELRFVKRDEAEFATALSRAQQAAASLEPKINALATLLQQGEADREKETSLRWQAGYDLALGRVLAVKVRTETYNAMLAAAKRGLKPSDPKNNTWVLRPADEISVGSQYAKQAEKAKMYLQRVVKEHPGTPWALLAQRELQDPLGWRWQDSFTAPPTPQPQTVAANNNRPVAPRNERAAALAKPPPKRPLPKL